MKLWKRIAAGPDKYIIHLSEIWMMRVPRSSRVSLRLVDPKDLEITAFNIIGPSFQCSFQVLKSHFAIIMLRWSFQHLIVVTKCNSGGRRNERFLFTSECPQSRSRAERHFAAILGSSSTLLPNETSFVVIMWLSWVKPQQIGSERGSELPL